MALADDLTVLILTYNEAPNIERTLSAVNWARRILVIDSGSTDATLELVARQPQAKAIERAFDSHASQCNFGLACIETEWVLSIDADYVLSAELCNEIGGLAPPPETAGFKSRFIYCIHGASLRSALYPPRCVLYRRARAHYIDEGHAHRVKIDGRVDWLRHKILHDDRKPLSRWFASQQNYAKLEGDYLLSLPPNDLRRVERVRLMIWPAPMLVLFYVLVVKRCCFDGWPGWLYAFQRMVAETLIALELLDRRLSNRSPEENSPTKSRS